MVRKLTDHTTVILWTLAPPKGNSRKKKDICRISPLFSCDAIQIHTAGSSETPTTLATIQSKSHHSKRRMFLQCIIVKLKYKLLHHFCKLCYIYFNILLPVSLQPIQLNRYSFNNV